jgi:hypothetical protein
MGTGNSVNAMSEEEQDLFKEEMMAKMAKRMKEM